MGTKLLIIKKIKINLLKQIIMGQLGCKEDSGKLRHDLVPAAWHEALAEVMTYGVSKYEANSWQGVEPCRYEAALMRHLCAWRRGELSDNESGLNHLKHVAVNALILFSLTVDKR